MKALVTAASKHGGTLEIAETIARVLEEHGLSAELVVVGGGMGFEPGGRFSLPEVD